MSSSCSEGAQVARGHGGRGGGAGAGVEQGQLAEHLAGAEDGQQVLPAGRTAAAQLDLAADHDVEPVLGVALAEQHLALVQPDRAHGRSDSAVAASSSRPANSGASSRLRVHAVPPWCQDRRGKATSAMPVTVRQSTSRRRSA